MKYENLSVKGMICVFCVVFVEKVIVKLDGIINVNVNLIIEKLIFDYDIEKVFIEDVKKVVKVVGYEVLMEIEIVDEY